MSQTMSSLLYGMIAGASTLIGIGLLHRQGKRAVRYSHYLNSFAAGALLAIAFFHLLPEAIERNKKGLIWCLLGFLIFYLIESVFVIHSGSEIHFKEGRISERHRRGLIAFCGLFSHSLIDGFVIGVGFEVSIKFGTIASLVVILHELPEGITTFSILIDSLEKRKALYLSMLVAIATPLGVILVLALSWKFSASFIGLLLALAAGSFLYISASDLIPEIHEKSAFIHVLFLLLGVVIMAIPSFIFNK